MEAREPIIGPSGESTASLCNMKSREKIPRGGVCMYNCDHRLGHACVTATTARSALDGYLGPKVVQRCRHSSICFLNTPRILPIREYESYSSSHDIVSSKQVPAKSKSALTSSRLGVFAELISLYEA